MKRRSFIRNTIAGTTGAILVPTIIPSCVLKNGPSDKIRIAQIGCGRIARVHDMVDTYRSEDVVIVACCDLDSKRAKEGRELLREWNLEKYEDADYINIKTFTNYRELLEDKIIDAVVISTPDHWHAQLAIEAALAGKDIYLQKPASLTIKEGRQMADAIKKSGRIFQIGSQQRSISPWPQFKKACELVRNGRIGQVKEVYIGLPGDPSGEEEPEMPIPENLNYDMWLGSTPEVYYTEKRVHPQEGFDRPGWLRCEQFGAGMITGWGAHHVDTAHWGMGTEFTGPVEVEAEAQFPTSGLWDVHGDFKVWAKYENGAVMHISGEYPNGVKFVGEDGWIFVTRGPYGVTASDPASREENQKSLDASDPAILESEIGEDEIHLHLAPEQHQDWINSIKTREEPVAPVEVAHRSCSACLVSHIAMKIERKLYWDPVAERFRDDDEANTMLSRPQRSPYGTDLVV